MRKTMLAGVAVMSLVAACGGGGGGGEEGPQTSAPAITVQPQGQSVTPPAAATFAVTATGNPGPTYQWKRNGTAIPLATSASYTTPSTDPTMNGESYTVTVTNSLGSVTSSAATLAVQTSAATNCVNIAGVYAGTESDAGHTTCSASFDNLAVQLTFAQTPATACAFTMTNGLVPGVTYYGTISGNSLTWYSSPTPHAGSGGYVTLTAVNVTFTPAQGSSPASIGGSFGWTWARSATASAFCSGTTTFSNLVRQ
jgi:hypothetical protein